MPRSTFKVHDVQLPTCVGEVLDYGAQVLRWTPDAFEPVLFVSTAVRYAADAPVRGGVPVCWPWFASGVTGDRTPAHGFARTSQWRLVERVVKKSSATFVHELTDADATSKDFPYPYRLVVRSKLGRELTVSLTITNTGDETFECEAALHTYLGIGDIRHVRVTGLDGMTYRDKLKGKDAVQKGDLFFDGETDRVYRGPHGPVTVIDPAQSRRLLISTEGAADLVVWNPWSSKARSVEDIGDGDWKRFVCIEAAAALDDALTLRPGKSHTIAYRLSVLPGTSD